MSIVIKKFQKRYFNDFDQCMIQLQDFLIVLDPLHRLRRTSDFSPGYAKSMIQKVEKHDGVIYLGYDGKKVVGCIVGVIEKSTVKNEFGSVPTKGGRIEELFVAEGYRSRGIGKKLMKKMETYMRKKKCTVVRVETFSPNTSAHNFYKSLGYSDRVIDLTKVL